MNLLTSIGLGLNERLLVSGALNMLDDDVHHIDSRLSELRDMHGCVTAYTRFGADSTKFGQSCRQSTRSHHHHCIADDAQWCPSAQFTWAVRPLSRRLRAVLSAGRAKFAAVLLS